MQNERKVVGFVGLGGENPDSQLLEWLAERLPVSFENRNPGDWNGLDGVIFLGANLKDAAPHQKVQVPSLLIHNIPHSKAVSQDALFTTSTFTPEVLRSRKVPQELPYLSPLAPRDGDEAIALLDERPVWTARFTASSRHDISALPLPRIDPKEGAKESFRGRNFLGLLPMYDFVHRVSRENEWFAPPVRACFIFDDPNLHVSSYGWLDYREIAQHAREHNYHAAFATVPLDGWYASGKSASFFSGAQARLSLLIHGNDHVSQELLAFPNEAEAIARLAQAVRRIERLEQTTGVRVDRVMVPPHGDCSELSLRVMARLGYEAVCTTPFVLNLNNGGRLWAQRLGLNIADVIGGTPVIARFRLDYLPRNNALLAAYLGQPILLYGHHQDLADGIAPLDDLADYINSLASVQWTNVSSISRQNYKTRRRDGCLEVAAYARLFDITVPSETEMMSVQRPWLAGQETESLRIRMGKSEKVLQNYAGERFPVVPGAQVKVESVHPLRIDPQSVSKPRIRVQPFLRRQFCAFRDRLQPAVASLFRARNGDHATPVSPI